MAWVTFRRGYDERITPRLWKRRHAGTTRCVRRQVAADAVQVGAAEVVDRPPGLRSCYDGRVKKVPRDG